MSRPRAGVLPGLLALALLLSGAAPPPEQDDLPRGPEGGRKLAAKLQALRPAENADWRGILKISGRNHQTVSIPATCEWTTGEANWSVTYLTAETNGIPAEKLTIEFSTNGRPRYFYARAPAPGAPLGELKALKGSEADIPLAGSDFWLSDLGFEFYHWPGQNLLKRELRRSTSCLVLESTNPDAPAGSYGRVKVWIETDYLAPLEAEAYGTDGKLLKEYELGSVKKVNGRYELKDLKISNPKTGSRTQLLFDLQTN
jgi:hypothetical protein